MRYTVTVLQFNEACMTKTSHHLDVFADKSSKTLSWRQAQRPAHLGRSLLNTLGCQSCINADRKRDICVDIKF